MPSEREGIFPHSMMGWILIHRELQLQRAHRGLARKPTDSVRPRSIVVKFLSFKSKEKGSVEKRRSEVEQRPNHM